MILSSHSDKQVYVLMNGTTQFDAVSPMQLPSRNHTLSRDIFLFCLEDQDFLVKCQTYEEHSYRPITSTSQST